ncbi:MAG: general secretion pathway protein GspK [Blastopirellula sp.]|nr:MAG: general secretion pathway protein GspK [Blastopirellula sp.]
MTSRTPNCFETFKKQRRNQQHGSVLFVVLIVIVMLTLSAYTFTELMQTENHAVHLTGKQIKAKAIAESGVAMLQSLLMQDEEVILEMGGIYDNPEFLRSVLVVDDEVQEMRGRFTFLAPLIDENGSYSGVRFGLEDESARVNLNALLMLEKTAAGSGKSLLMALPGMTDEIADAILDFMDEDDEVRDFGAEFDDYYSTLDTPYAPKNAPLETVEELLLVAGVTPELLFGRDSNRNGIVDPHEMTPSANEDPYIEEMLQLVPELGWSSYLTIFSMEKNYGEEGAERIFLNDDDLAALHGRLSENFSSEWADFIIAYRQNGPYTGSPNSRDMVSSAPVDLKKEGKNKFTQVIDLIGATVQVQVNRQNKYLVSPFADGPIAMALYLPTMMERMTVNEAPIIPGRININQAHRDILLGIPGLDEITVDEIISMRIPAPDLDDENMKYESWLLVEGLVTLTQMKALMPFITGGGDVYRTQVVGYFEGGSASSRHEVVIDTTQPQPRILLWRDISYLGRGHSLDVLGVELGIEDDSAL